MKGHAIIGFNHGVLGLAENPAFEPPDFFRQNTSGYAVGVLTPKASPRAGFSAKQSTAWSKHITLPTIEQHNKYVMYWKKILNKTSLLSRENWFIYTHCGLTVQCGEIEERHNWLR